MHSPGKNFHGDVFRYELRPVPRLQPLKDVCAAMNRLLTFYNQQTREHQIGPQRRKSHGLLVLKVALVLCAILATGRFGSEIYRASEVYSIMTTEQADWDGLVALRLFAPGDDGARRYHELWISVMKRSLLMAGDLKRISESEGCDAVGPNCLGSGLHKWGMISLEAIVVAVLFMFL